MLVILGTGLAGYSLLRELRKKGCDRLVMMICADDGSAYSKPMLSTGFTKGKQADELVTADAFAMAEQFNAEIRTFTCVDRIDPGAREIHIGEERVPYEDLVLALGAEVRRPPLTGDAVEEVLSVNDLLDYRRLRERMKPGDRIAILGAGLIGCEFANDFCEGGFPVELIAPSETVLPLLVPGEVAMAVEAGLRSLGVSFSLGRFAREVRRKGETAYELVLDDGSTREAEVVISAIGLQPRTGLASAAGLAVNRGVVTDACCRTSDPHIYALGDCAEVSGENLLYVLPLMNCARALAATLSGQETPVSYPVMPVMIKTPVCPVVLVPPAGEGVWSFQKHSEQSVQAECRDGEGRLLGFALCGEAAQAKQALVKELQAARG